MKFREHQIQVGIVKYLRANGILVFAIPNGGQRSAKTGAFLKEEGVMAGVADLIILLPECAIFVEVKNTNGTQQRTQTAFQKRVEELGFKYYVWRSVDDAVDFLRKIGMLTKTGSKYDCNQPDIDELECYIKGEQL